MTLTEIEEHTSLNIPQNQLQYVLELDDTYKPYARFIAALLIPRPSHAAFFRDLRSFRSQSFVISLLWSCDTTNFSLTKEEVKQKYREITTLFLQSRWSHPWCRKAAANQDVTVGSTGWWSAEWASTGRHMSKKERDAENRLHQLLLPIWVIMRSRMFPGEDIVQAWWSQKQVQRNILQDQIDSTYLDGVTNWLDKLDTDSPSMETLIEQDSCATHEMVNKVLASSNPFREGGEHVLRSSKTVPNLRQNFWSSAEAEQLKIDLEAREQDSAQNVFRLLATGLLLSKTSKWKLRRLAKSGS